MNWDQFPNFSMSEFTCKCGCKADNMDQDFMTSLQQLRTLYDKSMRISSGYRCAEHTAEKRKRTPGAHNTGKAADISVYGSDAWLLNHCAAQFPEFKGIGFKQKGLIENRFIHLDTVTVGIPRPALWSY